MKVVIMAGGKGTRLSSVSGSLPKPLVPVDGMPILEREINCLREQGLTDILLTVGYKGQAIQDYFGDGNRISPITGRNFGVKLNYFFEEEPLGNAGALFRIRDWLSDDFLLLNADSLFEVDFSRMFSYHSKKNAWATLLTHPNDHPYDSGLILADADGRVQKWLAKEDERPRWYENRVNAGIHILKKALIPSKIPAGKVDLDRQLLKPLADTGKLFCYDSSEYVKEMGTPERLKQVEADLRCEMPQQRSLKRKQKAIFLDRDGVLNKYVGFLRKPEELELLPGVAEAVRRINEAGYLAIVVTNQPVLARGEATWSQMQEIHNKLETLLGEAGAYVNAIYICPHHPDKGFPGEISELKVDCDCRKPKPGMLLKAAERFNIDLGASWMIGDSGTDIQAGQRAGTHTALVCGSSHLELDKNYGQDKTVKSLLEFINQMEWNPQVHGSSIQEVRQ